LELAVVKTVAGFMNAMSGTLLIGVDDEGQVLGLDNDFKITQKGNKDGFELWLTNTFMNCLGKTASIGSKHDLLMSTAKKFVRSTCNHPQKPFS